MRKYFLIKMNCTWKYLTLSLNHYSTVFSYALEDYTVRAGQNAYGETF